MRVFVFVALTKSFIKIFKATSQLCRELGVAKFYVEANRTRSLSGVAGRVY